ncbi:WD repeat-containing and planar cell polarity effector protein fritz isoform X2 [Homalodisca vitripennis]|uniref:WD repeat-containing and planar cell polarity effector protein fritz isoform X2 n=1 Tax=Homalodisca vitripennis TaxID=197043 RepID=UPI001EEB132B|nr:WD repeat-containing and planar cell polarity effector protein fritz isoform X2 [Homalodisca vitripennis]
MFTLLSEVHFWSFNDVIGIRDTDFGAFRLHDKKATTDSPFTLGKKTYVEKRGMTWTPQNKRPTKLKDTLKELEENLETLRVVFHQWRDSCTLQLMFNSGLLANITVSPSSGDVLEIVFDKFMVGKLLSEYVSDVCITNTHAFCSYNDNQVTLVHFTKPVVKHGTLRKWSSLDTKLVVVELAGPSGRRLERKLSVNKSGDMVLIWWRCTRDEVYPWSPQVKDQDRANVHVYSVNGTQTDLLCYYRTEHDPLSVAFSQVQPNLIHSVEQKVSRKGEVTVENCVYEISKARLQRTAVTCIPLQTHVCCLSFSHDDAKLLLGCIDGSLVLFDQAKGATHLVKAAFIPTLVCWHPDNCLVMVANERSQLQCFDTSLACVKMQLISEDVTPSTILDLGSYFRQQPTLLQIGWSRKSDSTLASGYAQTDAFLLLLFERGPMGVVRMVGPGLTPDTLVSQYLSVGQVERAVNLLLSLNWDTQGLQCLTCLHLIANHVLRLPLTPDKEVQLETALGSFHVPSHPLSHATEVEFGDPVRDLTRRFFHQLLRYRLFEKAFRLAIDLNEYDLFMDLHHYARNVGDTDMAAAALEKAYQVSECDSQSGSSDCSCSQSSCSCSCDSSSSGDDRPTTPPPLPVLHRNPIPSRQKVKFSDTVTHITVPEEPLEECEDTEQSLSAVNTVGLPPPSLPLPRLHSEAVSLYLANKHAALLMPPQVREDDETGKIKVVHFGVV